jgi:hypothetical protein
MNMGMLSALSTQALSLQETIAKGQSYLDMLK